MSASFVHKQNVGANIAAEAPGRVFATGTVPQLRQAGALYFLQLSSLSPSQANGWITGQGFDQMISFTDIIPDEVQEIG